MANPLEKESERPGGRDKLKAEAKRPRRVAPAASAVRSRPPRRSASASGINLRQVVVLVWNNLFKDEVLGRAAQLAYFWLFSLFPLLIFLTTLLAFLPLRRDLNQWIGLFSNVLPPEAYSLLNNTFLQIISQPRGGLLSFSILVTIWVASSGMEAIITSLNIAYDAPLTRPWWKERSLAILLTLGLAALIIASLSLIFFGGYIGGAIARFFGLSAVFRIIWAIAQWPIAIGLMLFAIELIYYFAPNLKKGKGGHRWELFTPGAIFAVTFWLLISYGFRIYVSYFGHFDATYGALGGVMVLMTWLYLSGVAILVGGEINSVLKKK
jgi:membrane protein